MEALRRSRWAQETPEMADPSKQVLETRAALPETAVQWAGMQGRRHLATAQTEARYLCQQEILLEARARTLVVL